MVPHPRRLPHSISPQRGEGTDRASLGAIDSQLSESFVSAGTLGNDAIKRLRLTHCSVLEKTNGRAARKQRGHCEIINRLLRLSLQLGKIGVAAERHGHHLARARIAEHHFELASR